MTEAAKPDAARPHYLVKAFANAESAQDWLAHCVAAGYRLIDMASVEATNHFSKELEGLIWMVVELKEA